MEVSFTGGWAIDLYKARYVLAASVGVCIGMTLIYIGLMRCCAVPLAWISVALV